MGPPGNGTKSFCFPENFRKKPHAHCRSRLWTALLQSPSLILPGARLLKDSRRESTVEPDECRQVDGRMGLGTGMRSESRLLQAEEQTPKKDALVLSGRPGGREATRKRFRV